MIVQDGSAFQLEIFQSIQIDDINGVSVVVSPGMKHISLDGQLSKVDESEDGTDVVRIYALITDPNQRDIRAAFNKTADWFFDKMCILGREHRIQKRDSAPTSWLEILASNCIVNNAKAMRDDRVYRTLAVGEEQIEINIKYQYFRVDIAVSAGVSPSIIVSIRGLLDSNWEEISPLLYEIPFLEFLNLKT